MEWYNAYILYRAIEISKNGIFTSQNSISAKYTSKNKWQKHNSKATTHKKQHTSNITQILDLILPQICNRSQPQDFWYFFPRIQCQSPRGGNIQGIAKLVFLRHYQEGLFSSILWVNRRIPVLGRGATQAIKNQGSCEVGMGSKTLCWWPLDTIYPEAVKLVSTVATSLRVPFSHSAIRVVYQRNGAWKSSWVH